jgi:biopolymer transport protein ExbD
VPRRKEEPAVEVTLPITPMLDMSFQLLSFFVVTFRPPSQEGQLSVDLPKLDASPKPTDPLTIEDAPKDEYTITVNGDSEIRSISLKGATVTEKAVADTGSLFTQLKQIADAKGKDAGATVSITIEADDRLVYSKLIEVMDICKKAGFESMSMKPNRGKAGS